MTLNQCTKEELIFIIKRMAFRSYFKRAEEEIEYLLSEVKYERQKKLLKEAENWNTISADCRNKYLEILKPYEGKRVIDVPLEVVKEAEKVLKDAQFADKKWDECMKKLDCERR